MSCRKQRKSPLFLSFCARTKIKPPCSSMNLCVQVGVSESGLGNQAQQPTVGSTQVVLTWHWPVQCVRGSGAPQGSSAQRDAAPLSDYFPHLSAIVSHVPVQSFPTFESKQYWGPSIEMGRRICLQMTHRGKNIFISSSQVIFTLEPEIISTSPLPLVSVKKQTLRFREVKSQSQ